MTKRIDWVPEMSEDVRAGDYDTAWELEELRELCEKAKRALDVLDGKVATIHRIAFAVRVLGWAMVLGMLAFIAVRVGLALGGG